MSYKLVLYVVSNVIKSPKNWYRIRLLPFVHIKFLTLLLLFASTRYVKPGLPANMSAKTSKVFLTSSSARLRLILPHMFLSVLFVNSTFLTDRKKLNMKRLDALPRLTLFSLSCLIKSLVYTLMCLCDGQCTFAPIVKDMERFCPSRCSMMYQLLSAARKSHTNARHSHLQDLSFSASGFPCTLITPKKNQFSESHSYSRSCSYLVPAKV